MFELSDLHCRIVTHHTELAEAAPGATAEPRWRVRLLGAVDAISMDGAAPTLSHWPTRAVAALLARLALWPDRVHPREELVELLWPGVDLSVGRNRLRQALSTLKALLETRGTGGGAVLVADHLGIRVVPGALACDALDFERRLRAGDWSAAQGLYRGDLMPGHYDDWVLQERRRLAALWERLDAADRPFALPVVAGAGRLAFSA
jgi:DNA-binding SARP family transcriptional activator